MNKDFFVRNRKALLEKMEDGSVFLLYSGIAPLKSADQDMSPYTPNRNFYYLTGIDEQNVWLMMSKSDDGTVGEKLFITQPDEMLIKWNGKMLTKEKANEQSGLAMDDVLYMQDMERTVERVLARSGVDIAYFSLERLKMSHAPTTSEDYVRVIQSKYPHITIKNGAPLVYMLRTIKTPEEVECIRTASNATLDALEFMLGNARIGEYEYQWAADFEYKVARSGMRLGFETIAASGANATMLHYSDNDHITKEGDLILFDLGAEYNYYSADISRTFPISGKFTARQAELYNIVLEAMELSKDKMRPGEPVKSANDAVIDFYKKALRTAGLITTDDEVAKFYYHGVAHGLGLDVHDPGRRKVFEPGMVLTCEPGVYVAAEGIGIRLENDILVTEGAPEDLSGKRLLGVKEIEEFIAKVRK